MQNVKSEEGGKMFLDRNSIKRAGEISQVKLLNLNL